MQASKIRYTEKMMDEAEGFRSRTYRGLKLEVWALTCQAF